MSYQTPTQTVSANLGEVPEEALKTDNFDWVDDTSYFPQPAQRQNRKRKRRRKKRKPAPRPAEQDQSWSDWFACPSATPAPKNPKPEKISEKKKAWLEWLAGPSSEPAPDNRDFDESGRRIPTPAPVPRPVPIPELSLIHI